MKDKPCPRCTGQAMTWFTADNFTICAEHMAEIFKEIWAEERFRKVRMTTKHRTSA